MSSDNDRNSAEYSETFDEHFEEDHCYEKNEAPAREIDIAEDNTVVVSVGDIINKVAHKNVTCETIKREFRTSCIQKKVSCDASINHNIFNSQNTNKKKIAITNHRAPTREKSPPPTFRFAPMYLELCNEHTDMYLLEDEKLVKPGDKFESHDHFVQYLNENAKRWCFYYKCTDSRKPNTEHETYTYRCIYLRSKMNKYEKKGLRKRKNPMKTDCPCKIKLRHLQNEKELTAVYVCNHHDHEFSVEQFNKFQHGRRLPPNIREDMMDFMALQVPRLLIKKYVHMTTGFNMSTGFFYSIERNYQQKNKNTEPQFTEERLQFLHEQIAALAELCPESNKSKGKKDPNENEEDDESSRNSDDMNSKHKRKHEAVEKLLKLRSVTPKLKPIRNALDDNTEVTYTATPPNGAKTEGSVKCEIQKNPWVSDQCVPVLANRSTVVKNFDELDSSLQEVKKIKHIKSEIENIHSNNNTHETNGDQNTNIITSQAQVIEAQMSNIDCTTDIKIDHEIDNDIEYVTQDDEMDETNVEYLIEDNDATLVYVTEDIQENVAETTINNIKADLQQKSWPVLHVPTDNTYAKRHTVNNKMEHPSYYLYINKCTQTSEDENCSDTEESDNENSEIIQYSQDENGDNYVKYDYVHKYNIDQYMTHPQFPKYIDILAKQTNTNVLEMFTNLYNEKAMFQLITTQKGNEGNTKMRYIYDGKINKKRFNESKRIKLGEKLESILILKEKVRMLRARNRKLMQRNDHLQDIAIRMNNLK